MFNRNPSGKNQYGSIREYFKHSACMDWLNEMAAKASDATLAEALESYHREKLTNNETISERLKHEYGITMRFVSPSHALRPHLVLSLEPDPSASSVKRRRKELGLQGSGNTTKSMPADQARQLVINAMDIDRARRTGVKGIQHKIAFDTKTHLTRYFCCLMRSSPLTLQSQRFCVFRHARTGS